MSAKSTYFKEFTYLCEALECLPASAERSQYSNRYSWNFLRQPENGIAEMS